MNYDIKPPSTDWDFPAVNNSDNLGRIGQSLYLVMREKIGNDADIITCSGITSTQLTAMKLGNGFLLSIELFKHIAQSCFWQFLYSIDKKGHFRARLKTPWNVYRLTK